MRLWLLARIRLRDTEKKKSMFIIEKDIYKCLKREKGRKPIKLGWK